MTPSSNIYVAIEGIDGTGKTFVSKHIEERFHLLRISEPSDGQIGKLIQSTEWSAAADFFLFMADRVELLRKIETGMNLVSDRSLYSSFAYQGVYLQKYFGGFENYLDFFRNAMKLLPIIPTHIVVLYSDVDRALERVRKRGKFSRFERAEYLTEVQDLYFRLKGKINNIFYIDSNVTLDELFANVDKLITELLPPDHLHVEK